MGNLLQVLFSAIKAKITPIWTKIKLFTNIDFLRTRVFTKIRKFFATIFNVKPRHKKDYYGIGRWLVSKRLAFALVIIIGVVCCYYIFVINPPAIFASAEEGLKTFSYNSIPLRFTDGKVRIKAKSGYIAYEGYVAKGYAEGSGTLYDSTGSKVYEGLFSASKYNGQGTSYYPGNIVKYVGSFKENLYDGTGTLYRMNGSEEYNGSFVAGMKEGEGKLMDSAGKVVFTGNFAKDMLLYTDFLGKTTQEAGSIYTGQRHVYTGDNFFVLDMPDIDAVYYGRSDANNMSDTTQIEGVFVLSDTFRYAGEKYTSIPEILDVLGSPVNEGNSYILMPEAVCIHRLNKRGIVFPVNPELVLSDVLDDMATVKSFDRNAEIYLYIFEKDGIRYQFYCAERNAGFGMYEMELVE